MSDVYTGASMSLDGYISGPAESGFESLVPASPRLGAVTRPAMEPDRPERNVSSGTRPPTHRRRDDADGR